MRVSRVVALVLMAVLASACGSPAATPPDPTIEPAAGSERVSGRHVQIYSAVIHQIVEVDNTFGGEGKDVPFDHVLIDKTVGGDRSGMEGGSEEGTPLSPEMQEALEAELADL